MDVSRVILLCDIVYFVSIVLHGYLVYALGWLEVIYFIYAVSVVLGGYLLHNLSMIWCVTLFML